ncbi:CTP synthase [Frondihabitans sucicola]|uniref:CTP synthase n=1 Tax=Frondihabitans sucicola TaxID=1268041 RepID=A0ABN6XYI0_9MICO|nr:hypothetical protein [Frondihabitans sucicola]BDZ50084.1 CTP synthase [Frondihabitans sucicola]
MSLPPLGPELLVHSAFDDTAVRRAHSRGELVRLAPGRYVRADVWSSLGAADREILRIVAVVSCLRTPVVVSHASAAALWGLPRLGPAPKLVDVIDPAATAAWNGRYVRHHRGELPEHDVRSRYGLDVTAPARTAIDVARQATFRSAVTGLDHGLRVGLFTRDDLVARLVADPADSRRVKARRAVDFADPRADSPGESLSRVVMQETGFESPELQWSFRSRGGRADVDFWWPGVGIVGEFDGEVKYRDRSLRGDRSAEQVVIDEKNRENRIRARPEVRGFMRWTWRDAVTPGALERLLRAAGVPQTNRRLYVKRAN